MIRIARCHSAILGVLFGILASGQPAPPSVATGPEAGIAVTDPLVIAKCGGCHAQDEQGNLQRISWERTTPEGWQDELKQMILLQSLALTPAEGRSIVKSLSSSHGLAPQEADPVRYEAERRVREETAIAADSLRDSCGKCHSLARVLS